MGEGLATQRLFLPFLLLEYSSIYLSICLSSLLFLNSLSFLDACSSILVLSYLHIHKCRPVAFLPLSILLRFDLSFFIDIIIIMLIDIAVIVVIIVIFIFFLLNVFVIGTSYFCCPSYYHHHYFYHSHHHYLCYYHYCNGMDIILLRIIKIIKNSRKIMIEINQKL